MGFLEWLDANWLGAVVVGIVFLIVGVNVTNAIVDWFKAKIQAQTDKSTKDIKEADRRLVETRGKHSKQLIPLIEAETDKVKACMCLVDMKTTYVEKTGIKTDPLLGVDSIPMNTPEEKDWLESTYDNSKESEDEPDDGPS